MRGKVHLPAVSTKICRITPAYAGKRRIPEFLHVDIWDHPRLCGEKLLPVVLAVNREGSPPPMRGKGSFPDFP